MRGARAPVGKFEIMGDSSGQATVEYVLLLAFCVGIAILMGRGIISTLDRGILRVGGQLEKDLKSGRAPVNVWRN